VDVDAVRTRARDLLARLDQLRHDHADLQRKLLALTATATSPDGLVTVTVGPRGQVIRVELDARIYHRPDSRRLSDVVTATIHRATSDVMAEAGKLTRPYLPDEVLQSDLGFEVDGVFKHRDDELLRR
jgi:DNA-binding protein YbaB